MEYRYVPSSPPSPACQNGAEHICTCIAPEFNPDKAYRPWLCMPSVPGQGVSQMGAESGC